MIALYGGPPQGGRRGQESIRRIEEMERALARSRLGQAVRIDPRLPFDLGDWTIPGLSGAKEK